MAIDINRLGVAAQKQILRKIREQEAQKAAREAEKRTAGLCDPAVPEKKKNKLNAVKVGGYASKHEAERAAELRLMERAGRIKNLREQVEYVLIEPKYKEIPRIGKRGKPIKPKRVCVERGLSYIADFVYEQDGKTVVEDAKGYKGGATYRVFVDKRKMVLEKYGIKVREV
jgi:hypothetical protein